jgi:predicted GIY-YIG superfamily endonuclease
MKTKIQGIYIIENNINGKCYIGQSVDILFRWRSHTYKDVKQFPYPLYKAFKKYGLIEFSFNILEVVEDKKDLTKREIYWFNLLEPGYNLIDPRECCVVTKPIYQIDIETLEIINEFKSLTQAGEHNNINISHISQCCGLTRKTTGGYYWCYVKDYHSWKQPLPIKQKPHKNTKKVYQLDLETLEILNQYDSMSEAERQTGIGNSHISKVCSGKRNHAGGYRWKIIL